MGELTCDSGWGLQIWPTVFHILVIEVMGRDPLPERGERELQNQSHEAVRAGRPLRITFFSVRILGKGILGCGEGKGLVPGHLVRARQCSFCNAFKDSLKKNLYMDHFKSPIEFVTTLLVSCFLGVLAARHIRS